MNLWKNRSGSFQKHPPPRFVSANRPPTFHTQHSYYSTLGPGVKLSGQNDRPTLPWENYIKQIAATFANENSVFVWVQWGEACIFLTLAANIRSPPSFQMVFWTGSSNNYHSTRGKQVIQWKRSLFFRHIRGSDSIFVHFPSGLLNVHFRCMNVMCGTWHP